MREIHVSRVTDAIAKLSIDANYHLNDDILKAFKEGRQKEESEAGKEIFDQLIENAEIARKGKFPICQDTGVAVIFMNVGQDVHFVGGSLQDAINEGVRKGYTEGYLRKSMVAGFERKNTKDNTPAIVHTQIVPGDEVEIIVAPKGGGSENQSAIKMMTPSEGIEGIKKFVVERVAEAGPDPCPPLIIGVGIGGNFEMCAILAKKALLREIGHYNPDPEYAKLEKELLELVNKTGVGPQGLGGRITALAVFIEAMPCHIASFPVAVNINCHAARHKSMKL